ncbi:MAG: sulfotransferase family protein [Myxococcota bacterium]
MRDFVTVVSGVPRSGTSLMMQMLAAGGLPLLVDEQRPPDEDNPHGYFEYAPVKASARDVAWWGGAAGRAVKVVHALLRHLPESGELRIVLMDRDLGEVLRSQRAMLERAGGASEAEDEMALARVFEAQLDEARAWAVARPRTALLPVAHRRLIESPAEVVSRIQVFLGGGLDGSAMVACVDPDLVRSR